MQNKIAETRREIRKSKSKSWKQFCDSVDEAVSAPELWKRMRWVKHGNNPKVYITDNQKEELLHSLAPDYVQNLMPAINSNNKILEVDISENELEVTLSKKNKDTAPGDDTITYSMITKLPLDAKSYLLAIYNKILETGNVPSQWRTIKIVPIPKSGSTSPLVKFRPISLLTCLCKIFHDLIARRLEWFIESKNIIAQESTGFRKSQSCLDSLTRLITHIQIGLTQNIPVVACFLDIENAYNNVLVEATISILDEFNVGKKICNYLWQFLSERHLVIRDDLDDNKTMTRWTRVGLAQGDPISPLLFNIVTAKICWSIRQVCIAQYADDFVLFVKCNN